MRDTLPYQAPPIQLLKNALPDDRQAEAEQEDEQWVPLIQHALHALHVVSEVKKIQHGPAFTRFEIQFSPAVNAGMVGEALDQLYLALRNHYARASVSCVSIEVPNHEARTVTLREVLESPEMKADPSPLLIALGKDVAGSPVLCDLGKMPHLLLSGVTGSGKTVCLHSIICSLIYRNAPEQLRLIIIGSRDEETAVFNGLPHLLTPVVKEPKKAIHVLEWLVEEMLERYGKFAEADVRGLKEYNKANEGTGKEMPRIVLIVDEFADMMWECRKDTEEFIRRLSALARSVGIYLVLATQRQEVITGVIRSSIPSRIAFSTCDSAHSRAIIDMVGAEKLMSRGDMLYKPAGKGPIRVQGCFISDEEMEAVARNLSSRYQTDFDPRLVSFLEKAERAEIAGRLSGDSGSYLSGAEKSFQDLLMQAIEIAVESGQISISMLQRRLRIGYARAGRLMQEMENRGIISFSEGAKPREILITKEQYEELLRNGNLGEA